MPETSLPARRGTTASATAPHLHFCTQEIAMKQPRVFRARTWMSTGMYRALRTACHGVQTSAVAALIVCAVTATPVHAGAPRTASDSIVAATLERIATRGELASLRWPVLTDVGDELQRVYASRQWAPIWSVNGALTTPARALLASLVRVGERGLDPRDYDVFRLVTLGHVAIVEVDDRAEFDMMLSVAALRVLRGLYFGRVTATEALPTLRVTRDSVDLANAVTQLTLSGTPDSILDAAEPSLAPYRYLKRALASYRSRAERDPLAQARVSQITITMERWRWLPRSASGSAVIVNIPAYELDVWQAGSDTAALRMDVVVGNTGMHRTPVFADTIRSVEFAPYWIVPLSIATAELMPVAMRDPHILTVNNYEIVNRRGQVMVPSVRTLRMVLNKTAFIRQLPGGSNSLGRAKFLFPNVYDVYLHDSPVQSAFANARRDQSHGCIRIADPKGLAMWLLRAQPDWNAMRVEEAMSGRTPTRVTLVEGVPVYLFYATAVAQADGGVRFHDDIYGYDAELGAQLTKGYPYGMTVSEAAFSAPARREP
jgi:murein L,D-transpeptidase YcbB/YkuD